MTDTRLRIIIDASADAAKGELGQIAADLKAAGAASTETAAAQNMLALAMVNAQQAANRLSDAQEALQNNTDPEKQDELSIEVLKAQVALDKEAQSVTELQTDLESMSGATGEAATTNKSLGTSLTEINSGIGIAKEAYQGLKGVYDATAGSAVAWAGTIDKLARASGEDATQTSRMAIVLGDVGIQADSLDGTIRALTNNGLQFNLETLQKLAVQYQAIDDPIARDEFAMKNLGRSGLEVNEVLSKTPAELAEMAKQADYSGKEIDDKLVASMQAAAIKTQQLNDRFDALKNGVGAFVENELVDASDAFGNLGKSYEAMAIYAEARTGMITWDEAATRADALANGDLGAAFHYVTSEATLDRDAIEAVKDSTAQHIVELTDADYRLMQYGEDSKAAAVADRDRAAALGDANAAAKDAAINQLVQAGVQGEVTKNQLAYQKVIDANAPKVAALREEIAKYSAMQGQAYTVTTDAKYSQDEYNLAILKSQDAAQALAEYTGDDQEKLLGLKIAASDAADKVNAMGQALGSTVSGTADYSTKIAEDQAALDKLTGANSDAEKAMHAANREFAIQQAAATLTGQALLDFELQMGEIDKPTYNATLALQAADAQYQKTGDLAAYESAVRNVIDALNGTGPAAATIPAVLQPATDEWWAAHDAAMAAAAQIHNVNEEMAAAHDVDVKFTVEYLTKTYGAGGPGYDNNPGGSGGSGGAGTGAGTWPGGANGLSLVVPPGYQDDSYYVRASSGEQVDITPPGQGGRAGGDTVTYIINDALAMKLADQTERQRKTRKLNGYMA